MHQLDLRLEAAGATPRLGGDATEAKRGRRTKGAAVAVFVCVKRIISTVCCGCVGERGRTSPAINGGRRRIYGGDPEPGSGAAWTARSPHGAHRKEVKL